MKKLRAPNTDHEKKKKREKLLSDHEWQPSLSTRANLKAIPSSASQCGRSLARGARPITSEQHAIGCSPQRHFSGIFSEDPDVTGFLITFERLVVVTVAITFMSGPKRYAYPWDKQSQSVRLRSLQINVEADPASVFGRARGRIKVSTKSLDIPYLIWGNRH